ncbi:MAG: hypothetical protein A2289_10895 [Deltaproteobacteria bacterium RIFOXYA12_FULL_58_15]|nr:MAG: hypothetical protein A2289_10895 [Deltaproteobacteria bacterium RIFOXYA12_FULL_58_15]OGR09926.1 MAG: hypothetical protein A2341_27405 [Deltaproteobacteria bacterium RIFOXYB12_FULL_58_9]
MTGCPLTSERLHQLLQGDMDHSALSNLLDHLKTDCNECQTVLDAEGLDEETLLLHLCAAGDEKLTPQQQARSWANIKSAWTVEGQRQAAKSRKPRWQLNWRWLVGSSALATAAAAVLLLAIIPLKPPADDRANGIKGEAELPRVHLALRDTSGATPESFTERDVVEITHGIERAIYLVLFHWKQGDEPQSLFADRVEPSIVGTGAFPVQEGRLGYSFAREAGVHLFVAIVADEAVDDAWARRLLRPEWFSAPASRTAQTMSGHKIAIETIRVQVLPQQEGPR